LLGGRFFWAHIGRKKVFFMRESIAPASVPVTATRVLFLDIDGVLNSLRTCVGLGGYPNDFSVESMALVDHAALGLVRGLCLAGDVAVVLSSSWRILHGFASVAAGLDLPVVDRTPSLDGSRGSEIADWLARHPGVERYAIVDDDADVLPEQLPFFVQTNGFDGLCWRDFEKLCALFSVNPHDCAASRVRKVCPLGLIWPKEDAAA
jgi:HAD domain in Swiss Army Knife RNA repair proteins